MMLKGLGEEIIIEVRLPKQPGAPERTTISVQYILASNLASAVYEIFPKASVQCFIDPIDCSEQGCAGRGPVRGSALIFPKI
jgi:hypothetical protein